MAYMTLPVYNIDCAVGDRQPNRADDVRLVQELLNAIARRDGGWAPPAPLPADGVYSENLGAWIRAFQQRCAARNPHWQYIQDGKVSPMHMRSGEEWDGRFGARTVAVLYTLNFRSWEEDRQGHFQLGMRLHLREGKNG